MYETFQGTIPYQNRLTGRRKVMEADNLPYTVEENNTSLTEGEQAVIDVLREQPHLSQRELAKAIGISVAAVATRKSNALRKLNGITIKSSSSKVGSNNPHAKLKQEDVSRILWRYKQGEIQADLARDFNVTKQCINAIVRGRSWGNVKCED
jgi:DNA-binding XRE family transcriptional regulator